MPKTSDLEYIEQLIDDLGLIPEQRISTLLAVLEEEEQGGADDDEGED